LDAVIKLQRPFGYQEHQASIPTSTAATPLLTKAELPLSDEDKQCLDGIGLIACGSIRSVLAASLKTLFVENN
jgi:hypothetical protein